MRARGPLLFYCQHSLGLGHLIRSLTLARALSERFQVFLLSGGRIPRGVRVPDGVSLVPLPPLGMDGEGRLVSLDRRRALDKVQEIRRQEILRVYRSLRPRAVFIELFPFGRKKLSSELMPLLEEARKPGVARPLLVCSLRDILVRRGTRQRAHDERALDVANHFFDAVLVHADPQFARLEETFGPTSSLHIPVLYTGFVHESSQAGAVARPRSGQRILVSAGGGLVGEPLFRAAVEAHPLLFPTQGLRTRILAGAFLPDHAWRWLRAQVARADGLQAHRWVPDLGMEMRAATASVSQCGYNTSLDILQSQVPALVVPFAEGGESEQMDRALRLERLGAVRVLDPARLSGPRLADEIDRLLRFTPRKVALNIDGARRSAELTEELLGGRISAPVRTGLQEVSS
jgi:predicted glycosyltransferase